MRVVVVGFYLLVGLPAYGSADELTAGQLYDFCTSQDEVAKTACRFYVLGVEQGVSVADGSVMNKSGVVVQGRRTIFCTPDDLPDSAMVQIFVARMQGLAVLYPNDFKSPAVSLVAATLHKAYPCGK